MRWVQVPHEVIYHGFANLHTNPSLNDHDVCATDLSHSCTIHYAPLTAFLPPSTRRSISALTTSNTLNIWRAAKFFEATYFQKCFFTSRYVISPKTLLWSDAQDWQYVTQDHWEVYVSIPIAPVMIIAGIFHPRGSRESNVPLWDVQNPRSALGAIQAWFSGTQKLFLLPCRNWWHHLMSRLDTQVCITQFLHSCCDVNKCSIISILHCRM